MRKSKKVLQKEDLSSLSIMSSAEQSGDSKHCIIALSRTDNKRKKYFSNLWLVDNQGRKPFQFTYGDQIDISPKFSPDGKTIAFLSNRIDDKQFQLFCIPVSGGEARPLTDLKGAFGEFEWSPDSKHIVFCFQKKDKEVREIDENEEKKKLGRLYYKIDRVFYKHDGKGYLPKERQHLWLLNIHKKKAIQLTESSLYDEWSPSWAPDGKTIIFLSNHAKDPDREPEKIDIYSYSFSAKKSKKIPLPAGPKSTPVFSPDCSLIAFTARKDQNQWWQNQHLYITPVTGKTVINLTEANDFTVSAWTINDLSGLPGLTKPCWSTDSNSIYFQVSEKGNTVYKKISITTKKITNILVKKGIVSNLSFSDDQLSLAFFHGTMKNPGELWIKYLKEGTSKQLTNFNTRLLSQKDLGSTEEVWIEKPSGNKIHGWIFKPPNFNSKKKYPSILEIHGGPQVQYGNFFMFEFFYLAAQGYVIHCCNPRGSIGYGEKHTGAIWNNWGSVDYVDLMAWTDFIEKKPFIDKNAMGVTGGSYGGYMTNWIIGHTNRFRAAVTQRSLSNLISMWGTSDSNWYFQVVFGDKPPWESIENYWKQSPLRTLSSCRTPTLIIHSEHDLRCSLEQAEQLFVALKTLDVPTKMLIFPSESHGLSRGGRIDRRMERLQQIKDWFDKYLKS